MSFCVHSLSWAARRTDANGVEESARSPRLAPCPTSKTTSRSGIPAGTGPPAATSGPPGGAARPRSGTARCCRASMPSSRPGRSSRSRRASAAGRSTSRSLCERLVIVDLTERCIEDCRERFADSTNIEYHVNDGRSLEMVEDGSIDFAFSFDSLVHVELDVLDAYVEPAGAQAEARRRRLHPPLEHRATTRALTRLARRVPEPALRRSSPWGADQPLRLARRERDRAKLFAERCERRRAVLRLPGEDQLGARALT